MSPKWISVTHADVEKAEAERQAAEDTALGVVAEPTARQVPKAIQR
jgi:hypothetical protein